VGTNNPACQNHLDQGLGYFYSYVWIEAVRSMETATRLDPSCAMAWWGLGRALEKHGPLATQAPKAFKQAGLLRASADAREQALIRAALLERGLEPGAGDGDARKKAAMRALDELLAQFPEDEEAWYARAQLGGGAGGFGGSVGGIPFYHALLRVNPLHPGANHELVHFYETFRRPALGWDHANRYIESSPGIPHPFHMQAHLATRLGRWERTADLSSKAIELEQAYHKNMAVKPADDHQYAHHMEILMISLIHEGRFLETRKKIEDCRKDGLNNQAVWLKMAIATRDEVMARETIDKLYKTDRSQAAYGAGMWAWVNGNIPDMKAQVDVLRQMRQTNKNDKPAELRLLELMGLLACEEGDCTEGLVLLKRCVDRTKDDHQAHSWGNGAKHMESWGQGALKAGNHAQSREAFLEALAHDPGSVTAALGLKILSEAEGKISQAARYGDLANRSWRRADPKDLKSLEEWMRGRSNIKAIRSQVVNSGN
jgi:tetratricopeptide (TPR) repeat protein